MEHPYATAIALGIVTVAAVAFAWALSRILAKIAKDKHHSDAIRRRGRLITRLALGFGSLAVVAALLGAFSPKPLGLIDRAMQNHHAACLDHFVAEETCTAMTNCLRPGWETTLTDARIAAIEAVGDPSAFTPEESQAILAVELKCRAEHLS